MDRQIVYLGQVPRSLDVLLTNQNMMVGVAKLSEAVLGTTAVISGLGVSPTSPASLSVTVAGGQIYQQENLEASAISGLNADTHIIVKQGVNLDPQTLTFTPPGTVGFSQNFLIEAQYADSDTGAIVLTYQNPSSPGQTYQGPGGNGQQQNTIRKGVVALQIKAGTAATSGTQVTPSPDAGWVGVAVVTVAYGQTTITSGNITPYSPTSQILTTLPAVPAGVQSGQWEYAIDTGIANAPAVTLTPIPTSFPDGMTIGVKMAAAPTAASTLAVNGNSAVSIVRRNGAATTGGEWAAGDIVTFVKNGTNWQIGGLTIPDVIANAKPSSLTVYVNASTGNDSNNGLTSGAPFATVQGAINAVIANYIAVSTVTVNVANGTYNGFTVGASNVAQWNFIGNTTTPSNVTIQSTGVGTNQGRAVNAFSRANITLSGFKFISYYDNVNANYSSIQIVGPCVFTAPTISGGANALGAYNAAQVGVFASVTYSGAFASFLAAADASKVTVAYHDQSVSNPATLTVSGSASFGTAFATAIDAASIVFDPAVLTLSGSATGPRYFAQGNGIVNTQGSGSTYLPGSTSGSTATGGQYL